MKLTKYTIPQAKEYQCDICKNILCHKDMKNEHICYYCEESQNNHIRELEQKPC